VFPSVALRCSLVKIEIGLLSLLNLDASAEAYYSSCRVRIAPQTMQTASDVELCSLMVHEYGHLAGLDDSTDPNSVMYPRVGPNPVCEVPSSEEAAENARQTRIETIKDRLVDLRGTLRDTRKARRHAHGAKRRRLTRKVKHLEKRIRRMQAELKTAETPAPA
jgi:Matrixin